MSFAQFVNNLYIEPKPSGKTPFKNHMVWNDLQTVCKYPGYWTETIRRETIFKNHMVYCPLHSFQYPGYLTETIRWQTILKFW